MRFFVGIVIKPLQGFTYIILYLYVIICDLDITSHQSRIRIQIIGTNKRSMRAHYYQINYM